MINEVIAIFLEFHVGSGKLFTNLPYLADIMQDINENLQNFAV